MDDNDKTAGSRVSCLSSLKHIHGPFGVTEPFLLSLKDGQKMEHFLHSDVTSNFPYLVLAENGESSGENTQIFIVLEKDVLCECQPLSLITLFASSLVSYLAVYYAFNLEYGDNWKNIFKFLEEHVLGITPKRKSYQLKQIENKLLRKLKACSNTD